MFKPNQRFKLKALGINIYGGGQTLGMLKHFAVVEQWEEIALGRRTFDLNFQGIARPICRPSEWPISKYAGKVLLVYANPPCVPFSDASSYSRRTNPDQVGRRGKTVADRLKDPLLELTESTHQAALALRPQIFICESVQNAYTYGRARYEMYRDRWLKAGYSVTWLLTDALLHGAPCRRQRFHFLAHKVQLALPQAPAPTRVSTVRDAIGDLVDRPLQDRLVGGPFQHWEIPTGAWNRDDRWRYLLKRVPPFGPLAAAEPPGGWPAGCPRPSTFVQRLRWDGPSGTVLRGGHKLHPGGERWVTMRELMRLTTYPDEFRAASEIDICDSVLPCVAEFLAGVAKESIRHGDAVRSPTFSIVDWRDIAKPFHSHQEKMSCAQVQVTSAGRSGI